MYFINIIKIYINMKKAREIKYQQLVWYGNSHNIKKKDLSYGDCRTLHTTLSISMATPLSKSSHRSRFYRKHPVSHCEISAALRCDLIAKMQQHGALTLFEGTWRLLSAWEDLSHDTHNPILGAEGLGDQLTSLWNESLGQLPPRACCLFVW